MFNSKPKSVLIWKLLCTILWVQNIISTSFDILAVQHQRWRGTSLNFPLSGWCCCDEDALSSEEDPQAVQTPSAARFAYVCHWVHVSSHQPRQSHQTPLQLWERSVLMKLHYCYSLEWSMKHFSSKDSDAHWSYNKHISDSFKYDCAQKSNCAKLTVKIRLFLHINWIFLLGFRSRLMSKAVQ